MAPDTTGLPQSFAHPPDQGRRDGNNNSDGSTSLKWGSDGELSPVDLQRVLERLTNPDLTRCALEEQG